MGKMEKDSHRRRRRSELKSIILTTLAMGAVIALAGGSLATALVRSLVTRKKYQKSSISRSLKSLLDNGLVYFNEGHFGKRLTLTEKGKGYVKMFESGDRTIIKPKKWDKKFRVVIFDIKESRKSDRDRLRHFLKQLGFMRLQDSVLVYPYDCEDLITLIKAEFKMGRDILYMIVDSIEYDKPIRAFFDL